MSLAKSPFASLVVVSLLAWPVVAATVPVPMFRRASVYRMEWGAPQDRRQVNIKSIEIIGNGECIPVLLGITAVQEW